ncbi:bifunctional adenosylcobinamide kinase/adenosylcobinamide-phosphate guanylyltransferase [Lampropedia puyangensis]|uniref:Adenosylcobinamide kinase n=1 Tax=Lampropedia puyangensis TaxID=1330072 RepID=A0A4S8FD13_9BURK|nr:bifunctional adenosylcobinamide kinase/adenosylcobinamide-phosphate guanylyltransferase [Lampropedia puyangensis]THU05237.1 bifunctional adenosylcobinamide kinase/adenosylcobinamide-phosphate guanylyltransferase [Lampropedia puyangensis]
MNSYCRIAGQASPEAASPAVTLVLGGQKSGKSRHAEMVAASWLAHPEHEAVLVATAQAWDDEMHERITRHQADRFHRAPRMRTVEEPLQLADTITQCSTPQTLVVVDCLTLWLTNWLMPMEVHGADEPMGLRMRRQQFQSARQALLNALQQAAGPVLLVSNEMGWGVMPMGRAVRVFADELGMLNQAVAVVSQQVVLVVAGQAVDVKALAAASTVQSVVDPLRSEPCDQGGQP